MLVTLSNFVNEISIPITNTGNDRIDAPAYEELQSYIDKYETEYFTNYFGTTLQSYLNDYHGSDVEILSVKTQLTEAAAYYIFCKYVKRKNIQYNVSAATKETIDGSRESSNNTVFIDRYNEMINITRNVARNIPVTLWSENNCYLTPDLIKYLFA